MARRFDEVAVNDPVTLAEMGLTKADIDLIRNPSSGGGGGTVNTGDATAADVAEGKTFSSASLTNVTGTSTKNATVPNDAPILPVQAFVDASYQYGNNQHGVLSLANKSITKIAAWISNVFEARAMPGIDLSGNALSQSEVNSILSFWSGQTGEGASGTALDLSGGANANPTNGAVNVDAWNINVSTGGDAPVKFNVHSIPVTISLGASVCDFSGNAMSSSEVNALLAFIVANYPDLATTLNISGGTNAAPTGQGLTDKATLEGNGWTVTTN